MALPFTKKAKESKTKDEKASTLQLRDTAVDVAPKESEKKVDVTFKTSSKRYNVADHQILVKPLITEKTFRLNMVGPKYVFQVARDANKLDIKKAFFNIYGHMPVAVHVMRGGGEAIHFGKVRGTSKIWKKAIITLKKGEKLDDF